MPGIRIIAAALVALCSSAQAQDWPTRPVTMVVPFAAGGAFDVMARIFAPQISQSLGQQMIVENVGAAAGIVGTNRVAKATPDGYVFLLGSVGTHAYNQTLYKKLPYNAATDFAPVALFAEQPMVLLTRKDFPADNLQQFIAYAKANAAKLQYGSAGVGSTTHLSCALLNTAAGIDITHVPYTGSGPALRDTIAGHVDVTLTAGGMAYANQLKVLGVTSATRASAAPQVPAIAEILPGYEATVWFGFLAPAGTPKEIVGRLAGEMKTAVASGALRERLQKQSGLRLVAAPWAVLDALIVEGHEREAARGASERSRDYLAALNTPDLPAAALPAFKLVQQLLAETEACLGA